MKRNSLDFEIFPLVIPPYATFMPVFFQFVRPLEVPVYFDDFIKIMIFTSDQIMATTTVDQ